MEIVLWGLLLFTGAALLAAVSVVLKLIAGKGHAEESYISPTLEDLELITLRTRCQ